MFKKELNILNIDKFETLKPIISTIQNIIDKQYSIVLIGKESQFELNIVLKALQLQYPNMQEICASDIKKLNNFDWLIRNNIIIKSVDEFKIVEGQITKMENYSIQLRTSDIESKFFIGKTIFNELEREKVVVGDIIRIYKDTGFVVRLGRNLGTDNINTSEKLIEMPQGECFKTEKRTTKITLNQLDLLNCKTNNLSQFYSTELVPKHIRDDINVQVNRWIKEGKITIDINPIVINHSEVFTNNDIYMILQSSIFLNYKIPIIFIGINIHNQNCLTLEIPQVEHAELKNYLLSYIETSQLKIASSVLKKITSLVSRENFISIISLLNLINNKNEITEEIFKTHLKYFLINKF